MITDSIDCLPFPRSLVFEDVDQSVLDEEDDAEPVSFQTHPWRSYMSRVLPWDTRASRDIAV